MGEHEAAFIETFIRREKRQRYKSFLASSKRRQEVLDALNHGADVDRSLAQPIPPGERSAGRVEKLLQAKGAGSTCYVIADGLEIDGQDLPLCEALAAAQNYDFGVVLSCIPGQLAFCKEEAPGEWYLLERKLAT